MGREESMELRSAQTTNLMRIRNLVYTLSRWFEWIGITALALIVLIAIADVIGSKAFELPFPGTTELTALLQITALAGGLAYSKIDGRHIRVDLLVQVLPGKSKAILEICISSLGIGLFILVGWAAINYGLSLFSGGTTTLMLRIPTFPFEFWIALCCVPMCGAILLDLINMAKKALAR
jgi:C4-dicarboxylate transporter, DctQ subunit